MKETPQKSSGCQMLFETTLTWIPAKLEDAYRKYPSNFYSSVFLQVQILLIHTLQGKTRKQSVTA